MEIQRTAHPLVVHSFQLQLRLELIIFFRIAYINILVSQSIVVHPGLNLIACLASKTAENAIAVHGQHDLVLKDRSKTPQQCTHSRRTAP